MCEISRKRGNSSFGTRSDPLEFSELRGERGIKVGEVVHMDLQKGFPGLHCAAEAVAIAIHKLAIGVAKNKDLR